jgi:hypothetical protein
MGKAIGAPQESFDQTFSKVCREPTTKRRSLVATSETLLNGVSLLITFLFAPFVPKRKVVNKV